MTFVALGLLAFSVVDLVRWSPNPVSARRGLVAVTTATAVVTAIAALCGWSLAAVALVAIVTAGLCALWASSDQDPLRRLAPALPLATIALAVTVLLGLGGVDAEIRGPFADWYFGLNLVFAQVIAPQQFLTVIAGALFLMATSNRVVRLVLDAAGTPATTGENTLKGGRILGPMERLVVAGLLLSGDAAGAGFVIAAKGLLRLPEIRSSEERGAGAPDQVTEYFLIGTFASLLLAATVALLVIVAGS